ncbi:MAG: hypothetical protein AN484_28880, partial [Aphanizomenon flos-aquae WA102]
MDDSSAYAAVALSTFGSPDGPAPPHNDAEGAGLSLAELSDAEPRQDKAQLDTASTEAATTVAGARAGAAGLAKSAWGLFSSVMNTVAAWLGSD